MTLNNPETFISDLILLLKSDKSLDSIRFLSEFPNKSRPAPLHSVYVSLGSKFTDISPVVIGNSDIKKYLVTLSVDIFSPYSFGSEICNQTFFKIMHSLYKSSELNIVSGKALQINANRNTDSLLLNCEITFEFLADEVK